MTQHLYLSLFPEALIASQLDPEQFGTYYAVGPERKTQGQAAFFEIDPDFRHPQFPIDSGLKRCIPHENGEPKHSVYIAVYRVVEHVPVSALLRLYLTTRDGRTLGIDRAPVVPDDEGGLHLFQEVAPLHPLVVSALGPKAFHEFLMRENTGLSVPALCWTELKLGELAEDPERGSISDLPYENIDHLRSCLEQLRRNKLTTKMVDRSCRGLFLYRTIKNGIFYGTRTELAMFAFPSLAELREKHYQWSRSANI